MCHYGFFFFVPCCDVSYDFRIKQCSVHLFPQLFVGGPMSYWVVYVCLYIAMSIKAFHVSVRSEFRVAHYDFRITTMFSSSLLPVVCKRVHVLLILFVFVQSGVQHVLTY